MAKLENAKVSPSGAIVVKDIEIEKLVNAQLREFDKSFFDNSKALDAETFVELQLGKNVRYWRLAPLENGQQLLGTTAITDGKIRVIDEDGTIREKVVHKGDIVIDQKACKTEGRSRFTLLHEAWHAQFSLGVKSSFRHSTSANVGTFQRTTRRTSLEWDEHHADVYAENALMSKTKVKKLFHEHCEEIFGSNRKIVASKRSRTWALICEIARNLNVSATALAYRLRSLKLISDKVFQSLEVNKFKGGNK